MKIPVIIDGRLVQVDKDTSILAAARKAGITIPTLCYHEKLRPHGSCRLCTVEVIQNKRRRLVTSCNFPADAGMEVLTDTPRVREIRRMLIDLLLARCPDIPLVQTIARRMGIETSGLKKKEDKECILCGLCVRFCEEVVGVSAIGLSNRGTECEVATPFRIASDTCIGCGACTYICPTGCIEMVPDETSPELRAMNLGKLSLEPCPNEYECEACDTEKNFIAEIKRSIANFRSRFS
jgi:heterodisulfide reductase subunit A